MREGLIISVIGMGSVFAVLTIMMFLMIGIERLFRGREQVSAEPGKEEVPAPSPTVAEKLNPEKPELAAIAFALGSHIKAKGRKLGTSVLVNGISYEVELGSMTGPVVEVKVNRDGYRCCGEPEGLPYAIDNSFVPALRLRMNSNERSWRAGLPWSQGGYWARRGWTGRGSKAT